MVDNASLKSGRFLNGRVSEPDLLRWSHHLFCSRSILLLTDDKCGFHLQEHPIVDELLHLDCFQSFVHGKHDQKRIGHEFPGTFSFCTSSSIGWFFPISVAVRSSLLDDILWK